MTSSRSFLALVTAVALSLSLVGTAGAQTPLPISEAGVGPAVVGSTLAQLQSQLGPDYTIGPATDVLVDVMGYEISKDGEVVFIAAAVTGTDDLAPGEPLDIFIVASESPVTAEGLSVGTTVGEGVALYGDATLSFSQENESREFVNFGNQPDWLTLRTGTGATAGIYDPADEGPFFETTDFNADAPIVSVWVQCLRSGCPAQPNLPYTGATSGMLVGVGISLVAVGAGLVHVSRRKPAM